MKLNYEEKIISFLKWLSIIVIYLSARFLAVGNSMEGQLNFLAGFFVAVSLCVIFFTREIASKILNKKK